MVICDEHLNGLGRHKRGLKGEHLKKPWAALENLRRPDLTLGDYAKESISKNTRIKENTRVREDPRLRENT
jgi:hypothetical protein